MVGLSEGEEHLVDGAKIVFGDVATDVAKEPIGARRIAVATMFEHPGKELVKGGNGVPGEYERVRHAFAELGAHLAKQGFPRRVAKLFKNEGSGASERAPLAGDCLHTSQGSRVFGPPLGGGC